MMVAGAERYGVAVGNLGPHPLAASVIDVGSLHHAVAVTVAIGSAGATAKPLME